MIKSFGKPLAFAALVLSLALPASAATLNNGDFDSGTLDGWTVGSVNGGSEFSVVSGFDTTGAGASDAAHFNVGRSGSGSGGIALSQSVTISTAGTHTVSVDVAALGGSQYNNLSGGIFRLIVGGTLVDSIDFGFITANDVERATLGGEVDLAVGLADFTIEVLRPYIFSENTPNQYVDNAMITGPAPVPLPASMPLLLAAIGGIAVMRRKKAA